jgi:hypothetical protein
MLSLTEALKRVLTPESRDKIDALVDLGWLACAWTLREWTFAHQTAYPAIGIEDVDTDRLIRHMELLQTYRAASENLDLNKDRLVSRLIQAIGDIGMADLQPEVIELYRQVAAHASATHPSARPEAAAALLELADTCFDIIVALEHVPDEVEIEAQTSWPI